MRGRSPEVIPASLMGHDAFTAEARWGSGAALLDALPPALVREDGKRFAWMLEAPTVEEQRRRSGELAMRKLFPEWLPLPGSTSLLLAYLAHRHGRGAVVADYLECFRADRGFWGKPWQALADELSARS